VFYFVMSALVSSKNTHLRPPANQLGNLLRHWRNIRGKNQLDWLPPLELHRQWPPRNCGSNQCFPRTKPLRTNMPVSQRGGCMRETSRLLFSTSTRHEQPWLNASGSKTSRMTAQEAFTLPPSLGGRAATEQWYWRILSFGVFRWSGRRVSFNIRPSGRLPLKCCRKPLPSNPTVFISYSLGRRFQRPKPKVRRLHSDRNSQAFKVALWGLKTAAYGG